MDFELSEQQAAFRDLMREFARKSISPVAREWELAGRYPEEIVEEMKAMGLFGMLVPEEYGGHRDRRGLVLGRVRGDLQGLDGRGRDPGLPLARHADAGEIWHCSAAREVAAGSRNRQAALGHRAHRAAGGQRPAGHRDHGAPRRRLLRGQRLQDLDHQRAARRPAAGAGQDRPRRAAAPSGHDHAHDRAGDAGLHRRQGPGQARL